MMVRTCNDLKEIISDQAVRLSTAKTVAILVASNIRSNQKLKCFKLRNDLASNPEEIMKRGPLKTERK